MSVNKFTIPYILPKLELQNRVLLVGSSESLLNNFGELIDSYENIIRFNRAQLKIMKTMLVLEQILEF